MKRFVINFLLCMFFLGLNLINLNAVENKYQLSTHILDISKGAGAPLVEVQLYKKIVENNNTNWTLIDSKKTDENGRIKDFLLLDDGIDNKGIYKLVFLVAEYFEGNTFYPEVDVVFNIMDNTHYHVPITISNFGYSTYRGN